MLVPVLFAFLAADQPAALTEWFSRIVTQQLDKREAAVRLVQNRQQAEARKIWTRETLLKSLNGLPDYNGPLNARVRGVIDAGDYRIEKLSYESLPRYVVTANLYVPKTAGKHAAVLFAMGHWDQGKRFAQRMAGNLARKGFVVLAFDPVGQGERQQAFEERTGRSLIGGSVEQHLLTGALNLLVGDGEMRYFVKDGMRGVDYLISRPEVDAERIGMTGCSGGGTVTTFTSALDTRIKVAAPSCYMQTFRVLIPGPIGDAEQSNPNFIAAGLDQGDMVELFAPKPWLMTSTKEDFFTPAGAKPVFEEAQRFFNMYGAEDRIKWVIGEGGHGTPQPVREAIYEWMIRWLDKTSQANSREEDVPMFADHELWVTDRGHLTAVESRELYDVVNERMRARQAPADLIGYLKKWTQESEPDPALDTEVLPAQGTLTGHGVLIVQKHGELRQRGLQLAAEGNTILLMRPRGFPYANPRAIDYGDALPAIRASLLGRNLPLLRSRDVLRGVDKLAAMEGVKSIRAEASDVAGYWVLAAAALDQRIASVRLSNTPWSISAAFTASAARQLYYVAMPEFSLHWDTQDLLDAIKPRQVIWQDPTDWNQNVIPLKGSMYEYTREAQ